MSREEFDECGRKYIWLKDTKHYRAYVKQKINYYLCICVIITLTYAKDVKNKKTVHPID